MIVHGCLKNTVIELGLLFLVFVLLFSPHWLWPFYLFLFTCVSFNQRSWYWHHNWRRPIL